MKIIKYWRINALHNQKKNLNSCEKPENLVICKSEIES
jgi:hypothetical protein